MHCTYGAAVTYDIQTVAAKIFFSYAHTDESLRIELEKHLAALRRAGLIEAWHDRKIGAGSDWRVEIDENLRSADVILLLISSDFLASDYCYGVELEVAMQRHRRGEAVVIPIILRPVDWSGTRFAVLQALPRDARPVTAWPNRDEAFAQIALALREVIARPAAKTAEPASLEHPRQPQSQQRVLDAAMPKQVTVGRAAELLAMVRLTGSGGLRAVLQVEEDTMITPGDVRSRSLTVDFPCDASGEPRPATVTLRIDAPGFDPRTQEKQISIPVEGDSQVCGFLLTPKETGELTVLLDLLVTNVQQVTRTIKTRSDATSPSGPAAYGLVSIPLLTVSSGSTLKFAATFGTKTQLPVPQSPPAAAPSTSPPSELIYVPESAGPRQRASGEHRDLPQSAPYSHEGHPACPPRPTIPPRTRKTSRFLSALLITGLFSFVLIAVMLYFMMLRD